MSATFSAFIVLAAASVVLADGGHQVNVVNNCPSRINVFESGKDVGSIPSKGHATFEFDDNWSGFIYTDANGGSQDGTGSTRAGFYFPNNEYYIVRDPSHFNTGIGIIPKEVHYTGSCLQAFCQSPECGSNAFTSPPTGFTGAAEKPLFQCSSSNSNYAIAFCPNGSFPPTIPRKAVVHHPAGRRDPGEPIHPLGHEDKCVTVAGEFANGSPIVIADCVINGAQGDKQQFAFNQGSTTIRVVNTPFCVDAGTVDGVAVGIWECNGSASQNWVFTNNNQFQSFANGATPECLDNANGGLDNGNKIQTAACQAFDFNQFWV